MPRDYSTLPDPPDSARDIPNHPIPDLTYENAHELITEPDYVMVSFKASKAARNDFDASPSDVTFQREQYLWQQFYDRFESKFYETHSTAKTRKYGKTQHTKLSATDTVLFDELEKFFEDMVPLWSHATVSYCWADHAHPRANTILYQLTDRMPPHPKTMRWKSQTGIKTPPSHDEIPNEDLETFITARKSHWDYNESDEEPRFEYGPTHVLNGDYDAGGADITAYAWENFELDIRLDSQKDSSDDITFPSTYSAPLYEDIVDFVVDYPNNIDITELPGEQIEIRTKDTPTSLFPDTD